VQITGLFDGGECWKHFSRWEHHGSRLWLQLDIGTGDVRLCAGAEDFGIVYTLPSPLDEPVFAGFDAVFRSRDLGNILEIL
jgi:hypothetical protein